MEALNAELEAVNKEHLVDELDMVEVMPEVVDNAWAWLLFLFVDELEAFWVAKPVELVAVPGSE